MKQIIKIIIACICFLNTRSLSAQNITLVSIPDENHVTLTWDVPSLSQHIQKYVIEKSHDGIHFTSINQIVCEDDIHISTHYSYVDKDIHMDSSYYYRLFWDDQNSKRKYSNIIKTIPQNIKNAIILDSLMATLEVYLNGKIVDDNSKKKTLEIFGSTVVNTIPKNSRVDITTLPAGGYTLEVIALLTKKQ